MDDEDEILARYGLHPQGTDLDEIRGALVAQTARQGWEDGPDPSVMLVHCVQLYNAGSLGDVRTVWRAKIRTMDTNGTIDVHLLCGAGLAETKAYLADQGDEEARQILDYLLECEAAGDFSAFDVEK
ncbi:hypothetical protein [Actinoplanes sp. NPDC049681]|uniref:hypothetical protein n=1 Tax=Actinoplanes sp. NPDC049681 TaxID=3363905 RepID=UPI0037BBE0AC